MRALTPPMQPLWSRQQAGLFSLFTLLGIAIGALLFLPAIPQSLAYHAFHDGRAFLGIPNALNVLSNIPFVAIGALGLWHLAKADVRTMPAALRPAYGVLCAGIALTGFGSAYYHWSPDNRTLIWDRLPMALAFMGLFATVIGERVSLRLGRHLLWPLVATGIAAVVYWAAADDLRPYAIVQFYPLLAIPVLTAVFGGLYTRGNDVYLALGCYVVAKALEEADGAVFHAGHIVSGHSLKHLAAAAGAYVIVRMVMKRQPLPARI